MILDTLTSTFAFRWHCVVTFACKFNKLAHADEVLLFNSNVATDARHVRILHGITAFCVWLDIWCTNFVGFLATEDNQSFFLVTIILTTSFMCCDRCKH